MSGDYYGKKLQDAIDAGDFGGVKAALQSNADVNFVDKEMKGGLYYAIKGKFRSITKLLMEKGADLSIQDCDGNTIMHIACDISKDKQMVLYMLMAGVDYKTLNNMEKAPADDTSDVKLFMEEILEEYRCFGLLSNDELARLTDLFQELDYDNKEEVDSEKAARFNKFVDKRCSTYIAEKDANDFIASAAMINGDTVTLEEWLFAWAKLYACEKKIYDKFFDAYDEAVREVGMSFKEFMQNEIGA